MARIQACNGILHLLMQSLHLCLCWRVVLLDRNGAPNKGDDVMLAWDGQAPPAPEDTNHRA